MELDILHSEADDDMLFDDALFSDASQLSLTTELTVWDETFEQPDIDSQSRVLDIPFDYDYDQLRFQESQRAALDRNHAADVDLSDWTANPGSKREAHDQRLRELSPAVRFHNSTHESQVSLVMLSPERRSDPALRGVPVIDRVEMIFEQVTDCLSHGKPLSVALRTRRRRWSFGNNNDGTVESTSPTWQTYRFPGQTPSEAWRFCRLLMRKKCGVAANGDRYTGVVIKILDLIHEALNEDVTITKR